MIASVTIDGSKDYVSSDSRMGDSRALRGPRLEIHGAERVIRRLLLGLVSVPQVLAVVVEPSLLSCTLRCRGHALQAGVVVRLGV